MDDNLQRSFDIILHAGNAKTLALDSIDLAEDGEFEKSELTLKNAQKEMNEAHLVHKNILDKLAAGENVEIDLMMAHALDHMTSAEVIILLASRFNKHVKKEKGND